MTSIQETAMKRQFNVYVEKTTILSGVVKICAKSDTKAVEIVRDLIDTGKISLTDDLKWQKELETLRVTGYADTIN